MVARIALLIAALCCATPSLADRYREFDLRIYHHLEMYSGEAARAWLNANRAREEGRSAEAIRSYARVVELVPGCFDALRRQAAEELRTGDRRNALIHGREALKINSYSFENMVVLAAILVSVPDGQHAPGEDVAEAKTLIQEALRDGADDAYAHRVAAAVAIAANDADMLRTAVQRLQVRDPDAPETHYLQSTVAATEGRWSDATAALDRARERGLPEADYEQALQEYQQARPFYFRGWRVAAAGVVVWFSTFLLLLAAGAILSSVAVAASRQVRHGGAATGLSGAVRRAYAAVLSLCCMFYYASLPIVMLIVLAVAGAVLYGVFALGRVPVKLVVLVVVVAVVSLWAMVKSLFVRVRDLDPGMRLDLTKEPKLRAVLDDVAKRIGTRAVDDVYITPGTDVAVMERGKGKKKKRCLILGVAALDGFAIRPFKAVLAHEYGHFTNRDTGGGAFALAVRNSLGATAVALAQGGAAGWFSPAWLFVNGFHRVFMVISQGASRLQEVLADRWAVFAYGAEAFERGLRHVVERSVRFDAHVGATLQEVVDRKLPLANLYTYTPSMGPEDMAQAVEEALARPASPYDSHPSPAERFDLVRVLPKRSRRLEPDDESPVWSLFCDPSALQREMTAQVRENLRVTHGVEILAPTPA